MDARRYHESGRESLDRDACSLPKRSTRSSAAKSGVSAVLCLFAGARREV